MSKKRCFLAFAIILILMFVLLAANIMLGSVKVDGSELVNIILWRESDPLNYSIIHNIRMPRALSAMILGGGLALSGYLLQTFFSNPIVGPFVLGISSGAKLTVALVMIFLLSRGVNMSGMGMVSAAFIGAMLAMGFVLVISVKVKNMSILVVCGIMTGYICSAITDLVVTFADDSNIVNLHNWSMGSLSGMNWQDIRIMTFIILICLVSAFLMSKPIGAYRLGESYAKLMGVNITYLRVALILVSSLLAACVTAFAGPISFVGIAVPHLIGSITKTSDPKIMIPGVFFGGSIVTLFCDMIARTIFAPTEVSISSVTAVLLVPVVIMIMIKRRDRRN
ncbi:MAG: iron ABC transporter permease [Lachnospiraceae bacterium]|nr:iron ABC transporter permease [Lachnospiraceae bacterium]